MCNLRHTAYQSLFSLHQRTYSFIYSIETEIWVNNCFNLDTSELPPLWHSLRKFFYKLFLTAQSVLITSPVPSQSQWINRHKFVEGSGPDQYLDLVHNLVRLLVQIATVTKEIELERGNLEDERKYSILVPSQLHEHDVQEILRFPSRKWDFLV